MPKPLQKDEFFMINLTDKYKTRAGVPVTIYSVNLRRARPVLAAIHEDDMDIVKSYNIDGSYYKDKETNYDLIKVGKYDHIKIDDKVVVWNDKDSIRYRRHFAGVDEYGLPLCFKYGETSWTSITSRKRIWKNCVLAEDYHENP